MSAVKVDHRSDGNHLSWEKSADARAYRVYRLRNGSPPFWVDSPYRNTKVDGDVNERLDADGKTEDRYIVHVISQAGLESSW